MRGEKKYLCRSYFFTNPKVSNGFLDTLKQRRSYILCEKRRGRENEEKTEMELGMEKRGEAGRRLSYINVFYPILNGGFPSSLIRNYGLPFTFYFIHIFYPSIMCTLYLYTYSKYTISIYM